MSAFWIWFNGKREDALETGDGKAFAAAGFEFFHNGGGTTAWKKELPEGRFLLVTNTDGGNHEPEGEGDSYMVGFFLSSEDVDGIYSDGHATAENAVKASAYFEAMSQFEVAGRFDGWRSGDEAGQLLKNFCGASIPNVFWGDWSDLCRIMKISPATSQKGTTDV